MGSFSMSLYRLNIRSGQSRSCDPPLEHLDVTRMKLKLPAPSLVSVDASKKIALDAARPLVALYLAEFPNVARESGIPARFAQPHRDDLSPRGVAGCSGTRHRCDRYRPYVRRNNRRGERRSRTPSGRRCESADCQPRTERHGTLARATGPVTGWDARYSMLPDLILDLSQETLHRSGGNAFRQSVRWEHRCHRFCRRAASDMVLPNE